MVRKNEMVKKNDKPPQVRILRFLRSVSFQRLLTLLIVFLVLSAAVSYQAAPKKYQLAVGDISQYDINAPRDIENTVKTKQNAQERADELDPVIVEVEGANDNITSGAYEYFDDLETLLETIEQNRGEADPDLHTLLKQFDEKNEFAVLAQIPPDKLEWLLTEEGRNELARLKAIIIKTILPDLKSKRLMEDTLDAERSAAIGQVGGEIEDIAIMAIADDLLQKTLIPNCMIDEKATKEARNAVYESIVKGSPVIIYKDERIISKDDPVTEDIFEVLKQLNYIDSEGKPDYLLYIAVFFLIFSLAFLAILYIRSFHPAVYRDKNAVMLMGVSILITTLFAWLLKEFIPDYAHLIIPTLVAPVIISIFLGIQPAIAVNLLLTFSFSIMFGGNMQFVFMSFIGGTFAAYLTRNATQRRRISLAGVFLGFINAAVTALIGMLEKKGVDGVLYDAGLAFVNGIFSIVLAIGILPFLESTFNVITPLKLLELADPNHPLLKRLLMEAPGTYHHSLMVGNLAEVATREIGGNSLLARVGAYFHDIGKLKRPNFFKENQMADNPHDRLTPNLSSLIITSHTKEGEEMGIKYKLPKIIRDIIVQHHGTTLVAYFYHKATQADNSEELKETNFRYEGPLPNTKEAAVVMLADSVEAAVRAMPEKTKGKIEGLVRKIVKDKLDDGQLDHCDLTLKDLSIISESFMQVLSGIFHERPEYPEFEKKNSLLELDNEIYNLNRKLGGKNNENNGVQPSEKNQIIQGDA